MIGLVRGVVAGMTGNTVIIDTGGVSRDGDVGIHCRDDADLGGRNPVYLHARS